jgi:hypothetical protein
MRYCFIYSILAILLLFTLNGCTLIGLGIALGQAGRNVNMQVVDITEVDSTYLGHDFTITDTSGVSSSGVLVDFLEKDSQLYEDQVNTFVQNWADSTLQYPSLEDTVLVAYAPAIKKSDSLICLVAGFGFNSLELDFIAYQENNPDRHARMSRRLYRPPDYICASVEDIAAIRLSSGTLLTRPLLRRLLNHHRMPVRRMFQLEVAGENKLESFDGTSIMTLAYKPRSINGAWYIAGGLVIDTVFIFVLNHPRNQGNSELGRIFDGIMSGN